MDVATPSEAFKRRYAVRIFHSEELPDLYREPRFKRERDEVERHEKIKGRGGEGERTSTFSLFRPRVVKMKSASAAGSPGGTIGPDSAPARNLTPRFGFTLKVRMARSRVSFTNRFVSAAACSIVSGTLAEHLCTSRKRAKETSERERTAVIIKARTCSHDVRELDVNG